MRATHAVVHSAALHVDQWSMLSLRGSAVATTARRFSTAGELRLWSCAEVPLLEEGTLLGVNFTHDQWSEHPRKALSEYAIAQHLIFCGMPLSLLLVPLRSNGRGGREKETVEHAQKSVDERPSGKN